MNITRRFPFPTGRRGPLSGRNSKYFALFLLFATAFMALAALPQEYEQLKTDAENLYTQRSFALANQAYQKAEAMDLPAVEKRWVEFRLADTQWRSQAATQTADTTKLDRARERLGA